MRNHNDNLIWPRAARLTTKYVAGGVPWVVFGGSAVLQCLGLGFVTAKCLDLLFDALHIIPAGLEVGGDVIVGLIQ